MSSNDGASDASSPLSSAPSVSSSPVKSLRDQSPIAETSAAASRTAEPAARRSSRASTTRAVTDEASQSPPPPRSVKGKARADNVASPALTDDTGIGKKKKTIKLSHAKSKESESPEKATPAPADGPSDQPTKRLKVKLNRPKPASPIETKDSTASTSTETSTAALKAASSSFSDSLRDIADSEDEDEVLPNTKRRKRPIASADDEEEGAGRGRAAKRRSVKKTKQAQRELAEDSEGEDAEFRAAELDEDEAMSDLGSESSAEGGKESVKGFIDDEEDANFKPASKGRKGPARAATEAQVKAGSKDRTTKASNAAKVPAIRASDATKAAIPLKQAKSDSSKNPAVAQIRASAAASASAPVSPATNAGQPGGIRRPAGVTPSVSAGAAGLSAMKARPSAAKPRGSDMWDSLVAKPARNNAVDAAAVAAREAEAKKKADAAAEAKEKEIAAAVAHSDSANQGDPNRPSNSASSLPRPLGTSGPRMSTGPSSGFRAGAAVAPTSIANEGSIVIHMTPGLEGQHWDRSAYARLRVVEKQRNRAPDADSLLNLMEDAEVVHSFEEEWRRLRIEDRARYPGMKATQVGAGLEYARWVVEDRKRREAKMDKDKDKEKDKETEAIVVPTKEVEAAETAVSPSTAATVS